MIEKKNHVYCIAPIIIFYLKKKTSNSIKEKRKKKFVVRTIAARAAVRTTSAKRYSHSGTGQGRTYHFSAPGRRILRPITYTPRSKNNKPPFV